MKVDNSCKYKWSVSSGSQEPLLSGFYVFDYGNNHFLTVKNFVPIVMDMSTEGAYSLYPILWYYDKLGGFLYNWGYQCSLNMSKCSDPIGMMLNEWDNGGTPITLYPNSIYSASCQKYATPYALSPGTQDDIHLQSFIQVPFTAKEVSLADLSLGLDLSVSPTGTVPEGVLVRIELKLQNSPGPLYLSVDPTGKFLIPDSGKGTNSIDWIYGKDKTLGLKLQDGSIVYLSDIAQGQGQGQKSILNNGVQIPSSAHPLSKTVPGKWTIPIINFPGDWIYKPANFGKSSSFLFNDGTQQYITFGGLYTAMKIFISIYPSRSSFLDIDRSINITYSNIAPESLPSGSYIIKTADGKNCLNPSTGELLLGECSNSASIWNYNSSNGVLSGQVKGSCLLSSLDSKCSGTGELKLSSCNNADSFILGKGGELYLNRCGVCYSATDESEKLQTSFSFSGSMVDEYKNCDGELWNYGEVKGETKGFKYGMGILILIAIFVLVLFFIRRK